MIGFVAVQIWRWSPWLAFPLLGVLLLIDALFFASNIVKIGQGGWFALAIAVASFTTLDDLEEGTRTGTQEAH